MTGAANDGGEITRLLRDANAGNPAASAQLFDVIYKDLRRLAVYHLRRDLRERSLQPTALVHEAYLRLFGRQTLSIKDRHHFLSLAAQVMRHVLVDRARSRAALRRDTQKTTDLTENITYSDHDPDQMLALNAALGKLSAFAPRQSRVVEMRFFGGMNEEEIATVLNISSRSVKRDWAIAKVWLRSELQPLRGSLESAT